MKLSGTVTAIGWANPHTYLDIDVVDEQSGAVVNWAIELLSPNALARNGWSRNLMAIDDKVVVEGSAPRDGTQIVQRQIRHARCARPPGLSGGGNR